MKATQILTTTLLLPALTSASLVDDVKENIQSILPRTISPLKTAVQIPCCTKPPCPGCPAARGNLTLGLDSISFPQTGFRSLIKNPPGCGDGFDAQDCLRFFQVALITLERPIGISVEKIGKEGMEGEAGCGVESSQEECLRYLKGFLGEIRSPLEKTLGAGAVGDKPEHHGGEGGCGGEEGKSEL